jgi:hypothetical protein
MEVTFSLETSTGISFRPSCLAKGPKARRISYLFLWRSRKRRGGGGCCADIAGTYSLTPRNPFL